MTSTKEKMMDFLFAAAATVVISVLVIFMVAIFFIKLAHNECEVLSGQECAWVLQIVEDKENE